MPHRLSPSAAPALAEMAPVLAAIGAAVADRKRDRSPARAATGVGLGGGPVFPDGRRIDRPAVPAATGTPRGMAAPGALVAALPKRPQGRFLRGE